jgi:hypothetical protein
MLEFVVRVGPIKVVDSSLQSECTIDDLLNLVPTIINDFIQEAVLLHSFSPKGICVTH